MERIALRLLLADSGHLIFANIAQARMPMQRLLIVSFGIVGNAWSAAVPRTPRQANRGRQARHRVRPDAVVALTAILRRPVSALDQYPGGERAQER